MLTSDNINNRCKKNTKQQFSHNNSTSTSPVINVRHNNSYLHISSPKNAPDPSLYVSLSQKLNSIKAIFDSRKVKKKV